MEEYAVAFKVRITTVKDIYDIAEVTNHIPIGVEIVAQHGHYVVSARSVMGLMSLDLSEDITIKILGKGEEKFKAMYNQWIVEEEF